MVHDEKQILRWRQIMRRDFPQLGQNCVIVIPFSPETGEPHEVHGQVTFSGFLFETESIEPKRTSITQIRLLKGVPAWSMLPENVVKHFAMKQECIDAFKASPIYIDQVHGPASYI